MKQSYKPGSLLTLAVVIVGLLYTFRDIPKNLPTFNYHKKAAQKAGKANAGTSGLPASTVSQLQEGLEKREYHISYDSKKQSLQSPNRKQDLRAYYKPGQLTVRNRVDSSGHNFQLLLKTEGVFADGQKLYTPQASAEIKNKDNRLNVRSHGLTEQYINSEEGIRQNFIIENAPENTSELQVRLLAEGLKVNDLQNNELHFYSKNSAGEIEKQLVYNGLKCWDAKGRALSADLAYENNRIVIRVDVKNAAYPVTVDPIIANGNPGNANTILESDQAGANSGRSVSSAGDLNGDGYSDVVIGAPLYDKGETNEGAVFVHYGSATGISTVPAVILEGNQAECQFGGKAALAGDVNKDGFGDLIVGAPLYDKGQTNEGAAFIYHGSAAGIIINPALILEANQAEARFGQSVNLAGDVNNDGYSDVVVGALLYDKGQTNEGAAFVYHGSAAGITANVAAIVESNQAEARLGNSVGSAGDVNGDGYSDVIAGCYLYDKGELDEGAAFVYHGSALGIGPNAAITLESNQASTNFGAAVSFAGDVNGDGYGDVVVGAYLYDNGQNNEGAAFVYYGSGAGITTNGKKQLETNQASAQLGYAVCSAGDVNGDGYADIIVGANLYDNGQADEGAAFIFQGSATGIGANAVSVLESNQVNAQMGCAVASGGDVNGDGYSDVVVGSFLYDKGQSDEGGAFVWAGAPYAVDIVTATSLDANQVDCAMGFSVSGAGDLNGDGFGDVVVGAKFYDKGQDEEGVVFVYLGSWSGLVNQPSVILERNQEKAQFGYSVAGAGDVNGDGFADILVGAPVFHNQQMDEGAAFLYYGSSQGINSVPGAILESNVAETYLGFTVSTAGDINNDGFADFLIGASLYDNNEIDEGAVFIYYGSSSGPSLIPTIIESGQQLAWFGNSVCGAGDTNGDGFDDIIIGAKNYDAGELDEGSAFIYYGSSIGIDQSSYTILQSNQAGAIMGGSVSGGGDVNGDGYSDVIVGAPGYDDGQIDEGVVFVYYGSQIGVSDVGKSLLQIDMKFTNFGSSLSNAGDVDGDGYSDIIVGVPNAWKNLVSSGNSVKIYNGRAFFFKGSATGINLNVSSTFEVLDDKAEMGQSVSSAGDVNGDGYGDLIMGASKFAGVGAAFVAYGNNGSNLKNNFRLYNTNLTTIINQSQSTKPDFGAGLYTKSFLGGNKAKLVWETKPKGQGFSKAANNLITNSTQSTGSQNAYASLGLAGTELKNVIAKQGAATKVRVRVKYDPALALTGQTYGPWRYLPAYLVGNSFAPAPEDAMSETIKRMTPENDLEGDKVQVFPNPVSEKLTVTYGEIKNVKGVQLFSTLGKSVFTSNHPEKEIDVRGLSDGSYILVITLADGSQDSRRVVVKR